MQASASPQELPSLIGKASHCPLPVLHEPSAHSPSTPAQASPPQRSMPKLCVMLPPAKTFGEPKVLDVPSL
jgi:hypothetical protein